MSENPAHKKTLDVLPESSGIDGDAVQTRYYYSNIDQRAST